MTKTKNDRARILLVVGSGRSGTSLTAGLLRRVGWHVPTPEVPANASNPRGFSEPQWLVDFQEGLLERNGLDSQDPRPSAWEVVDRISDSPRPRTALQSWLEAQLRVSPHIVLKDPRSVWFLPLHRAAAAGLGAELETLTVLRPPSQTLASRRISYGVGIGAASLCAAWLSMMLEAEQRTRDLPRVFVRYDEVMRDWQSAFKTASSVMERALILDDSHERDSFVDPKLARAEAGWEGLDVPASLAGLCDRTYELLCQLVDGPDEKAMAELDELRPAYTAYYEGCRAVTAREIRSAEQRHLRIPRLVKHGAARSWRTLRS